MKTKLTIMTMALALYIPAVWAQDAGAPTPPPPAAPPPAEGGPHGGPGGGLRRPPPLLLLKALDANQDGIIDAAEIANAPTALKALDVNGDGKLTREEYLPPRPPRLGPPGHDGDRPVGPPPPEGKDAGTPPPPPPPENK